ncbi:hypothetical protein B484DRAFT_402304 [Ochromonadaceae sp. CCMP2298]|nr:hypothetical protein B484DRAFT_402304 [Ochromonadaceae sp. CCMP2298]
MRRALLIIRQHTRLVVLGADYFKIINGEVDKNAAVLELWRVQVRAHLTARGVDIEDEHFEALRVKLLAKLLNAQIKMVLKRATSLRAGMHVQRVQTAADRRRARCVDGKEAREAQVRRLRIAADEAAVAAQAAAGVL